MTQGSCPPHLYTTHLLVFQMCRVSGSEIPLFSACSSKKSKKYLTASGGLSSRMLRIALNRSSRNFCSVPYRGAGWPLRGPCIETKWAPLWLQGACGTQAGECKSHVASGSSPNLWVSVFSSVKYITETYLTGVLKRLGHRAGELVRPELVSGVLTVN